MVLAEGLSLVLLYSPHNMPSSQPALTTDTYLKRIEKATPTPQHFGEPLRSDNLSFHTLSTQCKVCLGEMMGYLGR